MAEVSFEYLQFELSVGKPVEDVQQSVEDISLRFKERSGLRVLSLQVLRVVKCLL